MADRTGPESNGPETNGRGPHDTDANIDVAGVDAEADGSAEHDVWDALFGDGAEPIEPRSLSRRAKLLGVVVAVAMLAGSVVTLVTAIQNFATIRDPFEIEAAAWERVADSEWGFLVEDIVIFDIQRPRIGATVTNNPPDGVVTIDFRPWNEGRLRELMDHEMGHLLDFAVWGEAPSTERRGGLESEAWAECAAVAAGTRSTDADIDPDDRYHCTDEEFAVYQRTVAELTEVCARWAERECRTR